MTGRKLSSFYCTEGLSCVSSVKCIKSTIATLCRAVTRQKRRTTQLPLALPLVTFHTGRPPRSHQSYMLAFVGNLVLFAAVK